MACIVKGCIEDTRHKNLMCIKHWFALPQSLRDDVRRGTEKGTHTLRAHPTREWLAAAAAKVGPMRNLVVYVGADSKIKRQFINKPSEEPVSI